MTPFSIRWTREHLGLELADWARIFCVTVPVAKSWETYRNINPSGLAFKLMVALHLFVADHARRHPFVVVSQVGRDAIDHNQMSADGIEELLHLGFMLKTGFGPTLHAGLGALLETGAARAFVAPVSSCHASGDGECNWLFCPQLQDNEPEKTGRFCPIAHPTDEES